MIKYAMISETGNHRAKNDDRVNVFEKDDNVLAILCDGMGGYQYGDFAAATVVTDIGLDFINSFSFIDNIQVKKWIFSAIDKVKNRLKKISDNNKNYSKMGTTIVGALIIPSQERIFVFNVGDSRCYALTKSQDFVQITKDQNVANKLIAEGLPEKSAFSLRVARHLTSAIGPSSKTVVEISDFDQKSYAKLQKLILTSDGVHEFVRKDELKYIVSDQNDVKYIANKLIETATINESNDNMSVIAIEME
ncbi:serine/threonine-protein phosphatase [Mycoplasma sp. NEAQ87857]|uniref:PP2C family protein-serine/threonine phosphatase n=1 Tax=Mycoplasma sp. NEAQ87857 TaxID=2683967 RepID=UPI001316B265|nr:protein phosphatase 2C domain-containing protein [Mycoplasma sp. NEAQ87857]QGZ97476.1 serine/threonine-protein phosphatase [Mycoplasma sp. NEAQ87857]